MYEFSSNKEIFFLIDFYVHEPICLNYSSHTSCKEGDVNIFSITQTYLNDPWSLFHRQIQHLLTMSWSSRIGSSNFILYSKLTQIEFITVSYGTSVQHLILMPILVLQASHASHLRWMETVFTFLHLGYSSRLNKVFLQLKKAVQIHVRVWRNTRIFIYTLDVSFNL